MAMKKALVPLSEVVETITLTDLCRISGRSADWVIELVDEGILEPSGNDQSVWTFESSSIAVILKVHRIQSDLRVNIPGIALVLSLADENANLKRRLTQLENDPPHAIWMPDPDH